MDNEIIYEENGRFLTSLKKADLKISEIESDILYEASCSDITLLKKQLGWVPTTSLNEGLRKIISYEENRTLN